MADHEQTTTPNRQPQSTPADFLGRPGDGMVASFLMEIQHELGRLTEKVDGVSGKVEKIGTKVDGLHEKYVFLKGAAWVIGLLVPVVGGLVWWSLGDQIKTALQPRPVAPVVAPPTSAAVPPGSEQTPRRP